jgi:hypothetical protein
MLRTRVYAVLLRVTMGPLLTGGLYNFELD